MIEKNIKNLSVEEIMQKIKLEAQIRKSQNNPIDIPVVVTAQNDNRYELQFTKIYEVDNVTEKFLNKKVYDYADFSKYHDIEFIKNCYRGLLKREADSMGLEFYLKLLRSGERSKSEIISILHYSKEGRVKNVKLLGSKKRYTVTVLNSLPFFGYAFKWLTSFLTLPRLTKRLNQYQNFTYQLYMKNIDNELRLQNRLNENIQDSLTSLNVFVNTKADKTELEPLHTGLESKADKTELEPLHTGLESKADKTELEPLHTGLESKADKSELELYLQTVSYAKEYMRISQQNMQNLIDEAKKRLPKKILNQKELLIIAEEEKHRYDYLYVAFEDRFRGSREEIKKRVEVYLPYIEKLPFNKEEFKALDVGCGRGEWIELLGERGYKAQGIDLNRIMVAKSQELGLHVKQADVIEYLTSLEDGSLSVITGFHIIEHLPFEVLMKMYEEAYRVLKKGGIVIFETPNPENLIVGACNFYSDATHINPLVPETTLFTFEQQGFVNTEIKRLHKYSDYYPTDDSDAFKNKYFYNEMDYSVIGYKS
jgi:O-antigen chain-terminating methyltransferase